MRDAVARLWSELVQRNRALAWLGLVHFALLLCLIVLIVVDDRQVTGLNRWIKPGKFAASVGIYAWTLAWYLGYLKGNPTSVRVIGRGVASLMYVEISCVLMQASRGVASHFNNSTPLDRIVFALMGLLIIVNTLFAVYTLLVFCVGRVELPSPYLWGIRLGLLIFILTSLEGFAMVRRSAHTVGLPDGGPGLPIVNWSTAGGDLRVAHFFGLHALQLIPLTGYFLSKRGRTPLLAPAGWTAAVALAYALVIVAFFLQALHGQPIVSFEAPIALTSQ
jgi:hypothetical protein